MKLDLFDYQLPIDRIAQEPIEPREEAKLMIIDRKKGSLKSGKVRDLLEILGKNDVLVFNRTKVIPARLFGEKTTGGKVEVLLVKQIGDDTWEAISRPTLKEGQKVNFGALMVDVIEKREELVELKFNYSGEYLRSRIHDLGKTPLPPYIKSDKTERELRRIYQTVYAREEGSVAAPTAGFHFSNELLSDLSRRGVDFAYVTLHIGLGTFRPVKTEEISEHKMHSEWFSLDKETAEKLNEAKKNGKRIIAVGTTSARVLETCSDIESRCHGATGETDIFIYPPYKFRFVDCLLTNFHLPKSTLLMLVSAFISFPNTKDKFKNFSENLIGKAYQQAIEKKYRFFSFGDAMLIT